jgi:thioredoxin reductase (NADPH)
MSDQTARAVIMTVDDEPQVLNAVERDLRAHYRAGYRIMKAGSGHVALDAARKLKARGTAVALFLVDERMPNMSGTEFLTEARKIHPDARKVLLTAYADTSAAIAGINSIGLDYYLMKPWDPPEERLYPVLDDLLQDWQASFRPEFQGIRVVGTTWSRASHEVKDFLSRNQIPYRWLDLDTDPAASRLLATLAGDPSCVPVVVFPDGANLVEPTAQQLAERVGFQIRAIRPFYDLIVVGGGPSGLAAAVYGASEGLKTVLVESDVTGGQAGTSSRIENYLGFPSGVSGADLARRATTQAKRFGAEIVVPQDATAVRVEGPYRIVTLADGSELSCHALVLATGMAVRRLDVPGIEALTGAGVFYGAALSEAASCEGRHVCVVGGANSAGQAAMLFSSHAAKVSMIVRGSSLSAGMSRYLVDRIEAAANIEVLTGARITEVMGSRHLERIRVARGAREEEVPTSHLFIFIGAAPRSDVVRGVVEMDDHGFILTGPDLIRDGRRPPAWTLERDPFLLETSVPGIFAAGDVRHGSTKRVAAAVGEGSASVAMVHRHLESV